MVKRARKKAKLYRPKAKDFAEAMQWDMDDVASSFGYLISPEIIKQYPTDSQWTLNSLRGNAQAVIDRMNTILQMGNTPEKFMENLDKWSPLTEIPHKPKQ